MSIWDAFGADPVALRDGAWLPVYDGRGILVCEILARYAHSPQARKVAAELREVAGKDLDDEAEAALIRRSLTQGVLLDWRGVPHPTTGDPLPYSPAGRGSRSQVDPVGASAGSKTADIERSTTRCFLRDA